MCCPLSRLCASDDIEAFLFECAGFPVAAQQVRERTGLSVFDAVTNAKLVMPDVTWQLLSRSNKATHSPPGAETE